ncbi:hypothetical protein, partial [Mammaliicoccus sciuri]|uniref:cupredoxin domain-containing protein n=1 Tax=Mammaliicoccus sciuri TaxID=1296 RepID=UPI001F4C9F49
NGELEHEFVLATTAENLKHAEAMKKNPDMEHDDPNGKRLAPKKTDEIVWKFSKPGEFEYSCLIPGSPRSRHGRYDRRQVIPTKPRKPS